MIRCIFYLGSSMLIGFICIYFLWFGMESALFILYSTICCGVVKKSTTMIQEIAASIFTLCGIILLATIKNCKWEEKSPAHQQTADIHPARRLLRFLDRIPQRYKEGPWSPVAHIVLLAYLGFLLLTVHWAYSNYQTGDYSKDNSPVVDYHLLQFFRLFGGLYGIYIVIDTIVGVGYWPLMSYTVTSWNLMTFRLVTAFIAGYTKNKSQWVFVADLLRFPALVGCTITVVVWWFALVPLIDTLLRRDAVARQFFWDWSSSFRLINLHLVNLPLVASEFILSRHIMNFFDLWVAMFVAFLYVIFYLNVLDRNGFHFYIIFTPRTHWCFASFGLVIAFYWLLFKFWNGIIQ